MWVESSGKTRILTLFNLPGGWTLTYYNILYSMSLYWYHGFSHVQLQLDSPYNSSVNPLLLCRFGLFEKQSNRQFIDRGCLPTPILPQSSYETQALPMLQSTTTRYSFFYMRTTFTMEVIFFLTLLHGVLYLPTLGTSVCMCVGVSFSLLPATSVWCESKQLNFQSRDHLPQSVSDPRSQYCKVNALFGCLQVVWNVWELKRIYNGHSISIWVSKVSAYIAINPIQSIHKP